MGSLTFEDEKDVDRLIDLIVKHSSMTPRWLKLKVASKYVAINKDKLKQLAEDGELVGYQDPTTTRGDWIFDRQSLDKYRLHQAREKEIKDRIQSLKQFV